MGYLLIVLLLAYTGLSIYVLRFWRVHAGEHYPLRQELMVLAPTLLLHGIWVWLPLLNAQMVIMSFGHALNLVTWLMLLMYWGGSFFYRLKGLQLFLYPSAVISLLLAFFFPGQHVGYAVSNGPFMLHVGSSLLAYCLFGLATLLAWLILRLEHDLHRRKMSALVSFLPPLLSLEKLMFQALWVGFALLTVSVASGTFFADAVFGHPFAWTHKSIFGILSWLIYAVLLTLRLTRSWRGKKVAIWVIIGFVSLMLAYIGSKFVLEVILGRSIATSG